MIQVNISNSATGGSWSAQFPDQDSVNMWLAQGASGGWWGSPQQAAISAIAASYSGIPAGATTAITMIANTAGAAGNILIQLDGTSQLSDLISAWNIANPSNQLTLTGDGTQILSSGSLSLLNGADAIAAVVGYVITQTDITAQVALQAAITAGLQAQQFGASIIAQVYAYNEMNLQSGALTTEQFSAMLGDTTIANIERLLSNGSLNTASSLINSYQSTLLTYFSSAQISAITSSISAYLA